MIARGLLDACLHADAVSHGVHGVEIAFSHVAPLRTEYDAVSVEVCFDDESGRPRKKPRWAREDLWRGDGLCAVTARPFYPTTAWRSVFLPYHLLDQPPGPFTLRARFSAALVPSSDRVGAPARPPVALKVEGTAHFEAQVTMPPLTRARFAVRRAEVANDRRYDDVEAGWIAAAVATGGASALVPIPRRYERPALQWTLFLGGARGYRSPAVQDSYSAAWGTSSPAMPLAPGDAFTLCVDDEDIDRTADRIECFDFTLESYAAQVKSGKPLSKGAVKKLVLGAAQVSR